MTVRLLPLLCLLIFSFATVSAQEIRPLGGHDALRPTPGKHVAVQTKMDCGDPDLSAFERVIAGDSAVLRIDLDTAGLGTFVNDIRCFGCDDTDFGDGHAEKRHPELRS